MPHYPYLIVGGGMTADAAVEGIRQVDQRGAIGLIGAEPDPPYNRPPLSKALWKGDPLDSIWRQTAERGVDLHLGRTARALDPAGQRVVDDTGTTYTYDALLLATGGTPRRLPFGGDAIVYYRTLADYRHLRGLAAGRRRFAVIGGGFIGSEIAAALALNGQDVVMLFPEEGIGARLFPADLARFLNDDYRQRGVAVAAEEMVTGLEARDGRQVLRVRHARTGAEREVVADAVVAGLGITPNTALAERAGLTVDNGVVVDELLRASAPAIYAAGDVASFVNPALGRRLRVEHEDNANTMGRQAGRALAGAPEPYHHLPFFYSDLFDLGYEAVGDTDARLTTVADWREPHREGVIYYLDGGRVRGVLLWNVWGQVDAARRLIAAPGPFRPEELRGRLPEAASGSGG
ncbi:MAG TPA: FAD-dependent oxidoreductase [Thermomicrobiales bacterium]|nr:FAD-dependent oxidoreductase [Thermomicrobiales bacterium]